MPTLSSPLPIVRNGYFFSQPRFLEHVRLAGAAHMSGPGANTAGPEEHPASFRPRANRIIRAAMPYYRIAAALRPALRPKWALAAIAVPEPG